MKLDIARTESLLNIVEKCAGHMGRLTAISNTAMTELVDMNEALRRQAIANKPKPVVDAPLTPNGGAIFTSDNPNPNLADRRVK